MRMAMVTLLLATMGLSCSDGIPEEFISEDEAYRMGLESAKWRGLLGDPILCGAEFMTLKEMDALRGGHTNPEFAPSHVWMVAYRRYQVHHAWWCWSRWTRVCGAGVGLHGCTFGRQNW